MPLSYQNILLELKIENFFGLVHENVIISLQVLGYCHCWNIPLQAKPEGSTSGTKRKAASPPTVGAAEPPSVGSKKKCKEEWSCAICQVSATSEQGLNEHLQGKKHKSKEAGLRTQNAGKKYAIGLFPKKTSKPIKLVEPTNNKNSEQLQKSNSQDAKPDNNLALMVYTSDSKNKYSEKMKDKGADWKKIHKNKNRFKFWCEMCQVGAFSEKVLNRHKKGKKHVGQLERSGVAAKLEEATKVGLKDKEEVTENENFDGYFDGEVEENERSGVAAKLDKATKVGLKDEEETTENENLDGYVYGEVEENPEPAIDEVHML